MHTDTIKDRFDSLSEQVSLDDYNFDHFRARHLLHDGRRTLQNYGVMPGEIAPDFALPTATGETVRLSDLRGQPVLLHFGSYT